MKEREGRGKEEGRGRGEGGREGGEQEERGRRLVSKGDNGKRGEGRWYRLQLCMGN